MLKIKEIKYKLMDFGPDIGYPTLVIKFEDTEQEEKDYDIYKDLISKINEQNLNDIYTRAIDGSLRAHFCFVGSEILLAQNDKLKEDLLYKGISQASLDLQKDMRKEKMKVFGDIRPPFFMWAGIPKVCSGTRLAYENFNTAYTVLNSDTDFSSVALQEILNKTYSNCFIEYRNEKDLKLLEELQEDYKYWKIDIICKPNNKDKVIPFCLKNGLRCWVAYNDDLDIE